MHLLPFFPSPTHFTRVRRAPPSSLYRTGTQVGSLGGAGLLWIRFAAAGGGGDPPEHGAPLAPHTLRAVHGQVRYAASFKMCSTKTVVSNMSPIRHLLVCLQGYFYPSDILVHIL